MSEKDYIPSWLYENALKHPHSCAVITETGSFSYKEIFRHASDAASYFHSFGVRRDMHIGILFLHDFEFFIVLNSIWLMGAVPVPLNTRLTPGELELQIKNADIEFVITDEYYKTTLYSSSGYTTIPYSLGLKGETDLTLIKNNDPASKALLIYTSGSSGKPKAVVHTFSSLYESVKLTNFFASISPNDVFLASLPFYHVGGLMILIRALVYGATVAFPESLQFEDICDSIIEFRPAFISFVPTTLKRMNEISFTPNNNLKCLFLGGGPASDEIILDSLSRGWPVVKVYGSTETCSMVTALPHGDLPKMISSAGKPLPGVELIIKNEELRIKSPSLFSEYYKNKEETLDRISNGFFKTGDFGKIDVDGYLYIEARRTDIIITGGENVNVNEVENALHGIEQIEDAAVIAAEDKEWGQIVCAFVQFKSGAVLSDTGIKEHLKGKIASFKIPRKFIFVENIPRNEMGKIKRIELTKLYQ